MMTPCCTLVNFTNDSLDWLLELCLGNSYDKSKSEFPWDIETKYYKASVCINVKQAEDLLTGADPVALLSSTEAIMFYCDTSKATLERIDSAWGKVKEASPPVCLLVVEHATDQVQNGSFWDGYTFPRIFFGNFSFEGFESGRGK